MNKDFAKYDKESQRVVFIKIDTFNEILKKANAGVQVICRDVELHNSYQEYLNNCGNCFDVPIGIKKYEERYFTKKCSVVTERNIPACISICKALGFKSVAYEWAKDYYGRQLDDEIEVKYRV